METPSHPQCRIQRVFHYKTLNQTVDHSMECQDCAAVFSVIGYNFFYSLTVISVMPVQSTVCKALFATRTEYKVIHLAPYS